MKGNLQTVGGVILFLICASSIILGVLGGFGNPPSGLVGDITIAYKYEGESIVTNSCDILNTIETQLGAKTLINDTRVYPTCGKEVVKLNTINTKNVELGIPWINKTPIYGWSILMSILLCIGFIGGFVGGIILCMRMLTNLR
jgi:hypothetical protein